VRAPARKSPPVEPFRQTRAEVLADLAQEFTAGAIVSTFDYQADEVVSVFCLACGTESGHGPACPVPVLEAWLREAPQ
jgi:hypothetical protein